MMRNSMKSKAGGVGCVRCWNSDVRRVGFRKKAFEEGERT